MEGRDQDNLLLTGIPKLMRETRGMGAVTWTKEIAVSSPGSLSFRLADALHALPRIIDLFH